MPVLPVSFWSNYYLVEISNLPGYFNSIGCSYNLNLPNVIRFIASKFEITPGNDASKKSAVQGKPGTLIQDVKTPYYTYTIEAPLIINGISGNTNFLPFNSLNYFGLRLSNWQWQQLHGYNPTNTKIDIVLENYKINVTENETNQSMVFKTNYLLGDSTINTSGLKIEAFSINSLAQQTDFDGQGYFDISRFIGRIAKNYDMFTNMLVNNSFYLTDSPIFLSAADFEIKFDIEPKMFLNTGNSIIFLVKNYDLIQSFTIVGTENNINVDNFAPGVFTETLAINSLSLANNLLYQYQAPMIIRKRGDLLSANNYVSTTLDFSLYGANYAPGNSPYGVDLFLSDIS